MTPHEWGELDAHERHFLEQAYLEHARRVNDDDDATGSSDGFDQLSD